MVTNSDSHLESLFPGLASSDYEITSLFDPKYNCVAWAASDQKRWWEPDPMGVSYWPASAPRDYTLAAYQQAFESLGYAQCDGESREHGFAKVALFAKANKPTHASRQLGSSLWTSKLGKNVDITHELHALSGGPYGDVTKILRRAKRATP